MQGDALWPVTFALMHVTMHSNTRIDSDSILAFFCDEWLWFSCFKSSMQHNGFVLHCEPSLSNKYISLDSYIMLISRYSSPTFYSE